MYDQSASVYLQSIPELNLEYKIWTSKTTNLPLLVDTANDGGSMKVTMEEMARSRDGR